MVMSKCTSGRGWKEIVGGLLSETQIKPQVFFKGLILVKFAANGICPYRSDGNLLFDLGFLAAVEGEFNNGFLTYLDVVHALYFKTETGQRDIADLDHTAADCWGLHGVYTAEIRWLAVALAEIEEYLEGLAALALYCNGMRRIAELGDGDSLGGAA